MKKGRKLIAVLLVLCLMLSVMPLTAVAVSPYSRAEVVGGELLFTSDVHNSVKYLTRVLDELKRISGTVDFPKLIAVGGDYEDGSNNVLDTAVVGQVVDAAVAAGIPASQVVLTTGNHETSTTDADFLDATGWPRQGWTATAYTDSTKTKALYYLYSFGANTGTSYNFADSEIEVLGAFMAEHTDAPVFILSHYPLHYYNDRRQIINSDKVIDLLNNFPNAIFVWGHNHTEADPAYGKVLGEGSAILPAQLDENGAPADKDQQEILFTCLPNGALRGNTLNSELACYVDVSETTVDFTYYGCKINGSTKGSANQAVEQFLKPFTLYLSDVAGVKDGKVMNLNLTVDIPRATGRPANAAAVSDRFTLGTTGWAGIFAVDSDSNKIFDYDSHYDMSVTLTPTDGYEFCADTAATVNGENADVEYNSVTGNVTVTFTDFDKTVPECDPYVDAADEIDENARYVLGAAKYYAVANDATAAPVAINDDSQLTSSGAPEWSFIKDDGGYLLRNSEGNYLIAKDGEVSVAADPGLAKVADWSLDSDGYVNLDGAYLMFANNEFYTSASLDEATAVQIFMTYGVPSAGSINVAAINFDIPKADRDVPTDGEISSDAPYSVASFGFVPDNSTFAYGTVYEAEITLTADPGFTFDDNVLLRVNGETCTSVPVINGNTLSFTIEYPMTREVLKALPEGAIFTAVSPADQDAFDEDATYVLVSALNGDYYALVNNPEGAGFEAQTVTVSGEKIVSNNIYTDMLWKAVINDTYKAARLQNGDWYAAKVGGGPDATGLTRTETSLIGEKDGLWSYTGSTGVLLALGGKEADDALRAGAGESAPPPPPGGAGPVRADAMGIADGVFTNVETAVVTFYKVTYNADAAPLLNGEEWDVEVTAENGDDVITAAGGKLTGMHYDKEYDVYVDGEDFDITVKNGVYYHNGEELESLRFYSVYIRDYDGFEIDEQIVVRGDTAYNPVESGRAKDSDYYKIAPYTKELLNFSFNDPIYAETVVMVDYYQQVRYDRMYETYFDDDTAPVINTHPSAMQQLLIMGAYAGSNSALYTDVSKSDWFYNYVYDLTAARVVNGYPDHSFRPQEQVTWGQALKLVLKAAGCPELNPVDVHWASGYMKRAIDFGYISGPVELDAVISRGDIAELTAKAMKLGAPVGTNPFEDEATPAAIALYEAGILSGSLDNGHLLLRADSGLTRAEVSAIVWRINH